MTGRAEQGAVVGRNGPVAARRNGIPRPGETDWLESVQPRGRARCAARRASAMCRRSARSTSRGRDAGAFLDRVYINTFSTPAGRQGALWRDAARGRLRHGRRHDVAARPEHYFMSPRPRPTPRKVMQHHGVLPSGAVAGARRAMVSVTEQWAQYRDCRAALARRCCRGRRPPARPLQRGLSVSRGCASSPSAAAFRRGFSASRSRASWPTRSPFRRDYGDALVRALMRGGRGIRRRALRHRSARCHAHREGARGGERDSTGRRRRATSAWAA